MRVNTKKYDGLVKQQQQYKSSYDKSRTNKCEAIIFDWQQQQQEKQQVPHRQLVKINENNKGLITFDKNSARKTTPTISNTIANNTNDRRSVAARRKRRQNRSCTNNDIECLAEEQKIAVVATETVQNVQNMTEICGCTGGSITKTSIIQKKAKKLLINYNYNYNECFNKINRAFNSVQKQQQQQQQKTITTNSSITKSTMKKKTSLTLSTSLSLLSRVLLFSLLILLSATIITICQVNTASLTTLTTVTAAVTTTTTTTTTTATTTARILATKATWTAATMWAMQLIPTTTTIAFAEAANINYNNYNNNNDDMSTAVLQRRQQPVASRQLQQQQLFALLTQQQQHKGQPDIAGGELLRKGRGGDDAAIAARRPLDIHFDAEEDDSETDDDDADVDALSLKLIEDYVAEKNAAKHLQGHENILETNGFVSDDGQQYEKMATALQNNLLNCPKSCSCQNNFTDCSKLQLQQLPANIPTYVVHLDLASNRLNDSTVLDIHDFVKLNKLSLKRNQLTKIPKFVGLTALKHLNLAYNRIRHIDSVALSALKLKYLDLSKNNIHTLEANCFPTTNRLAHLMLNSNEIAAVEENAFEYLSNLLELELNNNRLTTLPAGVFKNLNKLRKLSLNFNHLEINWSTFRGLQNLQKLFLQSNGIRGLQDGVFHVMRAIETIELDHNVITSLSRQGLFNLTKLHHLSLSNNSISRIEPDTWEFTQSLITLDLSYNNISDFRPQHLDCLQRLRHLNLGHNRLHYLMDATFDCVKNLEDLNLRRNQLAWNIEDQSAIPVFRVLRKLKKLDLYGNNIKQITSKSFSGLSSLEILNIGGNALASVQPAAFEHMPHLQKLIFKSLNFICDCELLYFHNWLQRPGQSVNDVLLSNAICGYPQQLVGRLVHECRRSQLICAESPKPVITQEPSHQLAVKGANITMECIANSPPSVHLATQNDELKIKWRHDNQNVRDRLTAVGSVAFSNALAAAVTPITPVSVPSSAILTFAPESNNNNNREDISYSYTATETQIVVDAATNQTTIIGYLKLYNVSYESAGKYQCVVSNTFGTSYSQKFKISIGIHPTFLQIPSNITIDSGDTARLVCSATGDPIPEIALQKFGASDFPAATERRLQVIKEENAFIITNAKPIDTGIYTCTAVSAAGEIKTNASLIVNDKPIPYIPVVHKEVVLGQSSVLKCLNDLTAELLLPQREWYKDNKPFYTSSTSDSERYYFTAEKEFLVIDDTQFMDAGHYRCEIHDPSKNYIMQMELNVVEAGLSQNIIITVVATLTILCIIIASLIIWCLACYQKRKLNMTSNGARVGQLSIMGSRRHSGVLDQTQLTTLNRTYLRQQTPQNYVQPQQQLQQERKRKEQLRPHSLADLEYSMNGIDRNLLSATPTEQLNENAENSRQTHAAEHVPLTLDYLEHNQDHLSSKDSGTGSDAAVKRSIDDFTLNNLVPTNGNCNAATADNTSTPTAQLESYEDDAHVVQAQVKLNSDDEEEFTTTNTMGVSLYEVDSPYTYAHERTRFLPQNTVGLPQPAASSSCKNNVSKNLNGKLTNLSAAQAVDI